MSQLGIHRVEKICHQDTFLDLSTFFSTLLCYSYYLFIYCPRKKRLVWTHFLFHIFWSINTVMSVCPRQNSKLFRSTVYFSLGFFFWIYRFYLELKRIFTGEAILHGATHMGVKSQGSKLVTHLCLALLSKSTNIKFFFLIHF